MRPPARCPVSPKHTDTCTHRFPRIVQAPVRATPTVRTRQPNFHDPGTLMIPRRRSQTQSTGQPETRRMFSYARLLSRRSAQTLRTPSHHPGSRPYSTYRAAESRSLVLILTSSVPCTSKLVGAICHVCPFTVHRQVKAAIFINRIGAQTQTRDLVQRH